LAHLDDVHVPLCREERRRPDSLRLDCPAGKGVLDAQLDDHRKVHPAPSFDLPDDLAVEPAPVLHGTAPGIVPQVVQRGEPLGQQ
jgi:hypothetical protein